MLEGLGGQVGGLEASWRHLGGSWRLLEALGGILEALGGILEDLGGILEDLGRILEDFGRILKAKMEASTRVKCQGGGCGKRICQNLDKIFPRRLEHALPLPSAGGGGSNCAAAPFRPCGHFLIGQLLKDRFFLKVMWHSKRFPIPASPWLSELRT